MTTAALPVDLIVKLHAKDWSPIALADRFKVSCETIANLLKRAEPNKPVSDFAAKLEKLRAEVPNDYCRKELEKTVEFLRTYQAASALEKCRRITEAVESGARSVAEISEDAKLYKEEAELLIAEMVADGRLIKRDQGGIHNRGRKQKFHYFTPAEIESL